MPRETRKWSSFVWFIFIAAVLPMTLLLITKLPENLRPFIGGLKYLDPTQLHGVWSGSNGTNAVSPNLTTCHASVEWRNFSINCCFVVESNESYVDFRFPTSPLRVRRPAHRVTEDYIANYSKAVSLMKKLPDNDPRNFYKQRNIHCSYCTGAFNQNNSDIPLDIHRSWFFLPWHRMLLYFHERILGSLIGDDTFALPFWAWDIPEGMKIPQFYMNEMSILFDKDRDQSHVTQNVDLIFARTEPRVNITGKDQIQQNLCTMHCQMISKAKKWELFMGCPYTAGNSCNGPGTLENIPHNTVHDWTGSNVMPNREDMGALYTASRDPIFYAHHANVDRLWEVWRNLHENEISSNSSWLNSSFFFYDEKKQLVRIKVSDVVDVSRLRYDYEQVDIDRWNNGNACPKPPIPPNVAMDKLMKWKAENPLKLLSNFSLNTTITMEVWRPNVNRSEKEKKEEEEVLFVYGISFEEDVYTKFDVSVNEVNETIIRPSCNLFAGSFVYIPHGMKHKHKHKHEHNLKLGISELLEELEADGDESILVTLVPRSQSNIKIRGVSIGYVK